MCCNLCPLVGGIAALFILRSVGIYQSVVAQKLELRTVAIELPVTTCLAYYNPLPCTMPVTVHRSQLRSLKRADFT